MQVVSCARLEIIFGVYKCHVSCTQETLPGYCTYNHFPMVGTPGVAEVGHYIEDELLSFGFDASMVRAARVRVRNLTSTFWALFVAPWGCVVFRVELSTNALVNGDH